MSRRRNIKILATLGPATSSHEMIRALHEAGADVFRLNMSHGTHDDIRARHEIIRAVQEELGRPIGILADLQGPKLRVGVFAADAVDLEEGAKFRLDLDDAPGDITRVQLPHPEIFAALEAGSTLLLNDGKIRLRVDTAAPDHALTTVEVGGELSNRKGVNVPDVVLPLAALTEKDRLDLEFACELGVDWVALSFVQRAADMMEARELVKGRAALMAKIEKPAAVNVLDEILQVSDGVMVARGDLGVELPAAKVPPTQKRIVREARQLGRPVVVATQMLESMIESPVPTRAEVSDVANAVFEGADAVMLSAESAVGDYPIEAVQMMDDIAQTVESEPYYRQIIEASRTPANSTVSDAITAAAREVAETTETAAICTFTDSGATAIRAARERPRVPIIALTSREQTAGRLALVWGLRCRRVAEQPARFRECVEMSVQQAQEIGLAAPGDRVIITAGVPFGKRGSTNILRVAEISEDGAPSAVDQ